MLSNIGNDECQAAWQSAPVYFIACPCRHIRQLSVSGEKKKHKQIWENVESCTGKKQCGGSFSWRSISVVWKWCDGPFTTRCSSLVVGEVLSIQTLPFNTTRTFSVLFTFLAAKQYYVPITHKHSQKHDLMPFPEMDVYNCVTSTPTGLLFWFQDKTKKKTSLNKTEMSMHKSTEESVAQPWYNSACIDTPFHVHPFVLQILFGVHNRWWLKSFEYWWPILNKRHPAH